MPTACSCASLKSPLGQPAPSLAPLIPTPQARTSVAACVCVCMCVCMCVCACACVRVRVPCFCTICPCIPLRRLCALELQCACFPCLAEGRPCNSGGGGSGSCSSCSSRRRRQGEQQAGCQGQGVALARRCSATPTLARPEISESPQVCCAGAPGRGPAGGRLKGVLWP